MKLTLSTTCLSWARERAGYSTSDLAEKLHIDEERVQAWESDGAITLAHLDQLAHVTHTPVGFLFLPNPPAESLPVQDFRTVGTAGISRVSPELLDTLNMALRRQDWYRDFVIETGAQPLDFIGSLQISDDITGAADGIRTVVRWDQELRLQDAAWDTILSRQIESVEAAGILVMRNGVVGNNTHRPLDVSEFRGFALSDAYAPVIFINGRDAKAAQMFTLAHELAHLFLGLSGVSNLNQTYAPKNAAEQFCNKVAAELLVPLSALREQWSSVRIFPNAVQRLVRYFKVSSLVILRRLRDCDLLTAAEFNRRYSDELAQFSGKTASTSGGDFYRTLRVRLGTRFASAVVESALEGRTLYRDAYRLLGVANAESIKRLAEIIEVAA